MNTPSHKQGFTLIEMVVSIGLFTIVLFIATSAFLNVVNADRKSRAVRVAADNLNLALEDMQRRIRTGSYYYCGTGGDTAQVVSDTCVNNNSTFSFTEQNGTRTTYTWNGTSIFRTTGAGAPVVTTAPEINVYRLSFMVRGSALGPSGGGTDPNQPYVVISVAGKIVSAAQPATGVDFNIQTIVTQRNYDI